MYLELPADLRAGLDAWVLEQPEPKPDLPSAIQLLLRDYLVTMGILPPGDRRGIE